MKLIMENFRKFINEVGTTEMPTKLYHATYAPLLSSIQSDGLGGVRDTQWPDSVKKVVYLAEDPHVAESYAETTAAYEEFGYEIVVLEIDTAQLERDLFQLDRNVIDNEGDTVEYHGVVPSSAIKVMGPL